MSCQVASSVSAAPRTLRARGGLNGGRFRFALRRIAGALGQQIAAAAQHAAQQQEHQVRHARDQAHAGDDAAGDVQHFGFGEQLADHLAADVLLVGHARDDHTGRDRDDQRWNLRHQAVTDGQQRVGLGRVAGAHVVLHHADDQAADDVDQRDHDAGHGVALDVFRGAVHRAVEFGFLRHFGTALARFRLGDHAGVQVGVDRHLLARHRVQREARADFGDPARTLGDDGEVDDGENDEHDDTDRVVAADQEVAEGFDDLAGRGAAGVAFGQDDTGRGDVERQAQHGRHQQDRREGHEVERAHRVQRGQQHDHRQRDIEAEEQVEDEGRQRQDHHRQQQDDQDRRRQGIALGADAAHPARQSQTIHQTAPLSGFTCEAGFSGSISGGTGKLVGRSGYWPAPLL